jgi:hypothetical protein
MVPRITTLLALLPLTAAWPQVMEMNERMKKREEPAPRAPVFKSGRPNTGLLPGLTFNAQEQFINVTQGSGHEFASPGSGDIRGQCPGLNAAANHGFIPHNGIVSTEQSMILRYMSQVQAELLLAVEGLGALYSMSPDLSLFLAVVSTALAGDPLTGRWSIGGAFPPTLPVFPATGIAGTHNQYEGDASIVRVSVLL